MEWLHVSFKMHDDIMNESLPMKQCRRMPHVKTKRLGKITNDVGVLSSLFFLGATLMDSIRCCEIAADYANANPQLTCTTGGG